MLNNGLSSLAVRERREKYGPNRIAPVEKVTFFGIAKHEVTEPMILFLLVIGVLYSVWGQSADALTIFSIILILVAAEVFNEFRAKKAIAALAEVTAPKVRLLREGGIATVPSEEVVPGDILVLTAGTRVAADARLDEAVELQVDESTLTGESFPKERKSNEPVYAGTVIVAGEGRATVTATGGSTKLGKIAATAKTLRQPKTPLQLAMRSLAGKLFWLAGGIVSLILLLGLLRGQDLRLSLLTAFSLAFATIPEELPIIITMVLGLGVYTLSHRNFLVKRIRAGEALGSVTAIVTDKTGTITENRMQLAAVFPADRQRILSTAREAVTGYILSPLDRAIESAAGREATALGAIVRQRNFNDRQKTRAVVRKEKDGAKLVVNGAPEEVFAKCSAVPVEARVALQAEAAAGRRVIATALRRIDAAQLDEPFATLEKNMEFAGLLSFEDPPRPGVAETIAIVKKAGIRTVMVTGDHPLTAAAVARQTGIAQPDSRVITGRELNTLSDEALRQAADKVTVFARTLPEQKYRIVQALQAEGHIVAVTGDGINDALALKSADIGIAMGIRGTDVAKEAADVVLADDNFVTITNGVFEGRKFFDNLRKGVRYYLSVKTALVLLFLLAVAAAMPFPFSPIQIIVLELFMDLAASAGFVAEPAERDIFLRPPRGRHETVLDRRTVKEVLKNGAVFCAGVLAVYGYGYFSGEALITAQAMAFSAWIFGHIFLAFVSRSSVEPLWRLGLFTNRIIDGWAVAAILFLLLVLSVPALARRFFLTPLNATTLFLIAGWMFIVIGTLEVTKIKK